MEQFIKAIETIKNEFAVTDDDSSLYEICTSSLFPRGYDRHMMLKLFAISDACGDRLEKGFSKTVKGRGVVESYAFKGDVDDLYLYVAKYLLDNTQDNSKTIAGINFRYDWDEVTSSVRNAVACALQLNNLITKAVREYNIMYVDGFDENARLPSFMQLSSAILHYHFPQSAFLYNRKWRSKASKLFSVTEECKLCDVTVSNDVKEDLFPRYVSVVNYLRAEFVPQYESATTFWTMDYVNYCAYAYVLGCYIKERLNIDDSINIFALVNEVISVMTNSERKRLGNSGKDYSRYAA